MQILSLKPLASKGWDQITNFQLWPINRGPSNVKMDTKTNITLVYTLFSLLLQVLLQKQVTIEFSNREWFNPNLWSKHIPYNIYELSKHLTTIWNIKFTKFISHLESLCSQHIISSSKAFQFIPSITTPSLRSIGAVQIITQHL